MKDNHFQCCLTYKMVTFIVEGEILEWIFASKYSGGEIFGKGRVNLMSFYAGEI